MVQEGAVGPSLSKLAMKNLEQQVVLRCLEGIPSQYSIVPLVELKEPEQEFNTST